MFDGITRMTGTVVLGLPWRKFTCLTVRTEAFATKAALEPRDTCASKFSIVSQFPGQVFDARIWRW